MGKVVTTRAYTHNVGSLWRVFFDLLEKVCAEGGMQVVLGCASAGLVHF